MFASPWLRCRTPRPRSDVRVVCLPHAGGSAGFYGTWGAAAPEDVEVVAVQYPGREDRLTEPFADGMARLTSRIAAAVAALDERPTVLFGHSFGALVAYEVTRLLEVRHDRVLSGLVVSGRRAPSDPPSGAVHLLPDDAVVAELARLGGTGGELLAIPEARAVFLPAIREDFRLAETYRHAPGVEPGCPVTAVIGDDDTEVDAAQAALWAAHTTGPFALRTLPGGHFYLLDHAPAVLELATPKRGRP
ncbi:thioesterase II family protein [Umezawaea sp. NPDC059074]|uniref:thioesterase II family protein n=1 Tax=Umezawaea sp. NPDC059074 TaxID=3346716 RepID=UPI0036AEAAEA